MTSSSLSRVLILRDGRKLCYQSFGPANGYPMFFMHGFPGSRLQAALVEEQAIRQDVNLVALDRPGFGGSSPKPGRSIVDTASDVGVLADHLRWDDFDVVGVSCGGAFALACGHALRTRIRQISLVAGIAPMQRPDLVQDQARALRVLFGAARRRSRLTRALLWTDRFLIQQAPDLALRILGKLMSSRDRDVLRDNEALRQRFIQGMSEAYRQGIAASIEEAQLLAADWGFSLQDIGVPVQVFQGGVDRHVPPAMGRYLADSLPSASYHEYPADGHFSIIFNSAPAWLRAGEADSEASCALLPLVECA